MSSTENDCTPKNQYTEESIDNVNIHIGERSNTFASKLKYTGMTDETESREEISDMGEASRNMSNFGSKMGSSAVKV